MLYTENKELSTLPETCYVEVNQTSHKILKIYIGVNDKSQIIYLDTSESTED